MTNISTNISINISALKILKDDAVSCVNNGEINVACMQHWLCPQLSSWMITTGIWVCSIYIVGSWILWLWWNHIYTHIDWEKFYENNPLLLLPFTIPVGKYSLNIFHLGDLRKKETKIYWDSFMRDKMAKLLLGYSVAVLYFAISKI